VLKIPVNKFIVTHHTMVVSVLVLLLGNCSPLLAMSQKYFWCHIHAGSWFPGRTGTAAMPEAMVNLTKCQISVVDVTI